jgi:hypothetical protein
MPASSVAIALALRKNRSLGKTFWFTVKLEVSPDKLYASFQLYQLV